MQKCQIPKNYLTQWGFWSSMFGMPRYLSVTSDKKWHKTKCSQNFILGGVYSIQKCKICKVVFDPLQTSQFEMALGPQGGLKKITRKIISQNLVLGRNFQRLPILGVPEHRYLRNIDQACLDECKVKMGEKKPWALSAVLHPM